MTESRHRIAVGRIARVVVATGEDVAPGDEIARQARPRGVVKVAIARRLRLPAEAAGGHVLPRPGDRVVAGSVLARGPDGREARSSATGVFLWYSALDGGAVIAAFEDAGAVHSPLGGRVVELGDGWVEMSLAAAALHGIDGSGEATRGQLNVRVTSADEELRPAHVDASARGKVLVGGSRVSPEALSRARAMGAAGVVVGGVVDKELREFLVTEERRLAAARTASRGAAAFGILVLEGYGKVSLARPLFAWLRAHDGNEAVLLGAERTLYVLGAAPAPARRVPARPGDAVMVQRLPHLGETGRVVSELPASWVTTGGSMVPAAVVRLADGRLVPVPLANLVAVAAAETQAG